MAKKPEAPAPAKAQSEIGPTSYTESDGIVFHGPDDPETKAAYAAGHPADGIVKPVDAVAQGPAPSAVTAGRAPAAEVAAEAKAPAAARPKRKR